MLERFEFETPLGPIWLFGAAGVLADDRPVVLVILGALAPGEGQWSELADDLPEAAVLIAQLPGNLCPSLAATSVGAFAFAFDHVVQTKFSHREVIACGVSAGGLVALAMRSENVRPLALDPPLRTAKLWAAIPTFQRIFAEQPEHRDFLANVMGVMGETIEDRDYTSLLARPSRIVVGGIPTMPERAWTTMPSVVDRPELQLMRDASHIHVTVVADAGHMLALEAWDFVVKVVRQMLARGAQSSLSAPPRRAACS